MRGFVGTAFPAWQSKEGIVKFTAAELPIVKEIQDKNKSCIAKHLNDYKLKQDAEYQALKASATLHKDTPVAVKDPSIDIIIDKKTGYALLHKAIEDEGIAAVKDAISKGANVNLTIKSTWTPLHMAACKGYTNIVAELINHKANVNVFDKNGWSPLHLAASYGRKNVVELLLSHMSQKTITGTDIKDKTAINWAQDQGHLDIVALIQNKIQLLNQAHNEGNPAGEGITTHEKTSPWNRYSKVAIEDILGLRLKGIGIEHAKIISPNHIFNDVNSEVFIQDLVVQVKTVDKAPQNDNNTYSKLLIPINLNNQHWVGMTVEFDDGKIKVTYMDSEGTSIPQSLIKGLKAELAGSYPDSTIEMAEKVVELQKYNNCGLEVIENLISAIAGEAARIDQEEALEAHSMLYEQSLILEEAWKEKTLQEEKAKNQDAAGTRASNIPTEHYEELETVEADKEAKVESINVVEQISLAATNTDPVATSSIPTSSEILTEKTLQVDQKEQHGSIIEARPDQGGTLATSSLNTEQQPTELLMDDAWEETKHSTNEEVVVDKLEEVHLAEGEVESMSTAWRQVQDAQPGLQTLNTTEGEEIPIERTTEQPMDPLSSQQQPIELGLQPSNFEQEQIDPRYEAEKILMERMKDEQQKAPVSQPQQYSSRIIPAISPNEIASGFNFFMKWLTGGSACGGDLPTHNGLSSNALEILQGVRLIPTDSMGRPIRDSRDFMEAIESEFKALNCHLTDQLLSPQLPSSSLFEGIELSDIGAPGWSWIQQFKEEIDLSGRGEW